MYNVRFVSARTWYDQGLPSRSIVKNANAWVEGIRKVVREAVAFGVSLAKSLTVWGIVNKLSAANVGNVGCRENESSGSSCLPCRYHGTPGDVGPDATSLCTGVVVEELQ